MRNTFNKKYFLIFILLIVFSIMLLVCTNNQSTSMQINNDDIDFYGRDSCPFCVKMKKQLKQDNVFQQMKYIDVESGEGAEAFKSVEADGVPFFTCTSTGKSSTGFKSTNELLSELGLQ